MDRKNIKKLNKIFKKYKNLKLVYLFGSQASGKADPFSDYDFAFFIEGKRTNATYTAFDIEAEISKALNTNQIDHVIINHIDAPELKYSILKDGIIIYEVGQYSPLIEPKILNEYFDFMFLLRKHNLTKT